MPKMKTNRGAAKRFKRTGSGKVKRAKAFANHLMSGKTTKQKRKFRRSSLIDESNMRQIKVLLPYL